MPQFRSKQDGSHYPLKGGKVVYPKIVSPYHKKELYIDPHKYGFFELKRSEIEKLPGIQDVKFFPHNSSQKEIENHMDKITSDGRDWFEAHRSDLGGHFIISTKKGYKFDR